MGQRKEPGNWNSGRQAFKYCRNGLVVWFEGNYPSSWIERRGELLYRKKNQVRYSECLLISIIYCCCKTIPKQNDLKPFYYMSSFCESEIWTYSVGLVLCSWGCWITDFHLVAGLGWVGKSKVASLSWMIPCHRQLELWAQLDPSVSLHAFSGLSMWSLQGSLTSYLVLWSFRNPQQKLPVS